MKHVEAAIFAAAALAQALLAPSCMHAPVSESARHADVLTADLDACRTAARERRSCYEHYAEQADAERCARAASLFRALARSEHLHEQACMRAAVFFGLESDRMPCAAVPLPEVSTTADNLHRSIDDEQRRLGTPRGSATARAIAAGNYYIARTFIWIDGTNRRHIELLEECLRNLPPQDAAVGDNDVVSAGVVSAGGMAGVAARASAGGVVSAGVSRGVSGGVSGASMGVARAGECCYCLCPACGNVWLSDDCDAYCPLCRTPHASFESF